MKVLIIGEIDDSSKHYREFSERYECVRYTVTTRDHLTKAFKDDFSDVDAIYTGWRGFVHLGGLNGELLAAVPNTVKIVTVCSSGYENFDVKEMNKRGIILANVPSNISCDSVADLALYNALQSFRFFNLFNYQFNKTNHTISAKASISYASFSKSEGKVSISNSQEFSFGDRVGEIPVLSPKGHHAVIVGFGLIGRAVAKRLHAIGMKVHIVKSNLLIEEEMKEHYYVSSQHRKLSECLTFTDLLVLAVPETPSTIHILNDKLIKSFSNPFSVINVGRGSAIDENALLRGLQSGKVRFAGLDVYEEEPNCNKLLLGRSDVHLTPHIGACTQEVGIYAEKTSLSYIDTIFQGGSVQGVK